MKILIYQPRASYYVGGGEVVAINQAIHLIKKGHDVCFVTSKGSWVNESEIFTTFKTNFTQNVLQVEIPQRLKTIYDTEPGEDWIRWDLESFHFSLEAKTFIQNMEYDIGICHLPLDLIAMDESKKNIVYLHGYPAELNYACKLALNNQSRYVAVSERVNSEWRNLIGNPDIKTVYNGIDTEYFCPDTWENKNYNFLFVGRLLESKGIMNLLSSFSNMTKKHDNLKLAIAGTGPMEKVIKEYILANNIESNVEVMGYVPEGELLELYRKSKVAVLPSLSKEGILTTALEATACGVPVITSNSIGLDEYITDGQNGFLVDVNSENDLVAAMERLLIDNDLYLKMSGNARLVSLGWDWKKSIANLEKVISDYE